MENTAQKKPALSFLQVKEGRNYGIDLLRIVAMYMVVMLHVLSAGWIIWTEDISPLNYWISWTMEIAAYGAVNIYALISGFVGYKSKHRYANLAELWLRVFLYSIVLTVLNKIYLDPTIGVKEFIFAFFPMTRGDVWYFTMYCCLFFFMPVLNIAVEKLPRRTLRTILICVTVLFTFFPLIWMNDTFRTVGGYTVIWLIALYLIGAYIGKYRALAHVKRRTALLGYLICVATVLLSKFLLKTFLPTMMGVEIEEDWLVNYTSIPVFLSAVFLLLVFRDLRLPKAFKKIVAVVSPLTFGIFVIHVLPVFHDNYIHGKFIPFAYYSPIGLFFAVLGATAAIFTVCGAIDFVRAWIFDLLDVKGRLLKLEKKLRQE